MKHDAVPLAGSVPTAYRRLNALKSLGIAKSNRGYFVLNTSILSQPPHLLPHLLPSLEALRRGRRFGRYYNDSDIRFAENNTSDGLVTLDYKAWELTEFQYPMDFYVYTNDIDKLAIHLKNNQFKEGKKGHIVLLPMIGNFTNMLQRVYFDCIAKGGRSLQDAIAIELLHGDKFDIKGAFPIDLIQKVQSDLPVRSTT
ncbi:MAG: hypothetical protein QXJ74_10685 [Nitrososphaera sp.]